MPYLLAIKIDRLMQEPLPECPAQAIDARLGYFSDPACTLMDQIHALCNELFIQQGFASCSQQRILAQRGYPVKEWVDKGRMQLRIHTPKGYILVY